MTVTARPSLRLWSRLAGSLRTALTVTVLTVTVVTVTVVTALGLSGCGKPEAPPPPAVTNSTPVEADPIGVVTRMLSSMGSKDPAALTAIDPTNFVQHDLSIGDGITGLREYLAAMPAGAPKVKPVRLFRDGDLVVAQSLVETPTPAVEFDVFRFDKGKIVEHWDNIRPAVAEPNPGGHTMTDGPTAVTDVAATDANKAAAKQFVTDVLIGEKLDGFDAFFDNGTYIQHDPGGTDGAATLKQAIQAYLAGNLPLGYDKVQKVVGQGNFVLVVSSGTQAGSAVAYYDLFRLEKGKLAEHWGVAESILPRESWKNGSSGKF